MLSAVKLVVWALIACHAYGQLASWYACPETCTGECRCASSRSPVPDPPQFILLTHDDAVTSFSASTVTNALKDFKNPNGCDLPATFYVSIQESQDYLIQHLFMSNHEIADHTVNHRHYPDQAEIWGAVQWMNENAGIPIEEIRGFRAPFLDHDVAQRQNLYKLGLRYDASITEQPGDNQLFPYSLDHGVAIDCAKGTGTCDPSESYPGMWSVPLWTLPRATSMDITGDVYTQYMREFRKKYYGNRAPLGIFCHSGWLNHNLEAVRRFLSDALAMGDDVWVVTNWQLIQWMQNPVSAGEYRRQMTKSKSCPRKPRGPTPPSAGCIFGSWDKTLYRCTCQGEGLPSANGFCRDQEGACTVPKLFTNGAWHCPGENAGSLFSVYNQIANNVQNIANHHVSEPIKRSVQDAVQNVVNHHAVEPIQRKDRDKFEKVLRENSFYIVSKQPEQDYGFNRESGRYVFFGINIPVHPTDNSGN